MVLAWKLVRINGCQALEINRLIDLNDGMDEG